MDTVERWLDIVGYEGMYQISNHGRVKSLTRDVISRGVPSRRKERILAIRRDGKGYYQTRLYKGGASTYPKVHRLVGQHFLPNPNDLPQINHMDGDKLNNHISNLEWCTGLHNMRHYFAKDYKLVSPNGVVVEIHNMRKFAQGNGLTEANLHKVIQGKREHHKGWTRCPT